MNIKENQSLASLVAEAPHAVSLLDHLEVDYCCHGERPVADACRDIGITVDELSRMLGEAEKVAPQTEVNWSAEPLSELIGHIITTYHTFTREELAGLAPLCEKVLDAHGSRHPELRDVQTLIQRLDEDMTPHMRKEEQVLFPHVGLLEDACKRGIAPPIPFFGTVRNPIRMMMNEHEVVAGLLESIREVTGSYALPDDGCGSYAQLLRRLEHLERETHHHIHLENNILFPRAAEMEAGAGLTIDPKGCGGDHCCGGDEDA